MDRTAAVRAYYEALDDGNYERLAALLAPTFTQVRPDRRFEDREAFVSFMREERPRTDTRHPIDAVYERSADAGRAPESEEGGDVAVEGRLVGADGERIAAFVDVFSFEGERIGTLRTYTR